MSTSEKFQKHIIFNLKGDSDTIMDRELGKTLLCLNILSSTCLQTYEYACYLDGSSTKHDWR